MRRDRPIQLHYTDALGKRHAAPRAALDAIRAAMGGRDRAARAPALKTSSSAGPSGRASGADVVVCPEGERVKIGAAEVRLEDGTSLTVDRALPGDVPIGYHTIRRRGARTDARLIVAPARCYLPEDYSAWGWAVQLYAARSRRSWGIGDLADLRWINRWAASSGAGLTLVNPLASAAPVLHQEPSPYYPTSRRFRNPLYLRVEEMDGASEVSAIADLASQGRALNRERLIDRDRVYRLKFQAFDALWARARQHGDDGFEAYLREMGAPLIEYATFCALAERFGGGWRSWPAGYRTPGTA